MNFLNFLNFLNLCFLLNIAYSDAEESLGSQKPAPQWHHFTNLQVKNVNVAILPVGSIESHGPHLPLGTDFLLAESIVRHATYGLPKSAILPCTAYGASFEHSSHPGTIPIRDETLHGLWNDIIDGIVSTGVRKVLIVNGHGGQTPNAQIVTRNVRFRHSALAVLFDVQACLAEAYEASTSSHDDEIKDREQQYGIHGGLIETAVMLFLFPGIVDEAQCRDFEPTWSSQNSLQPYGRVVSYGWKSEDLCQHGAVGNAILAGKELGKEIFRICVAKLRSTVIEIIDTDTDAVLNTKKT